MTATLSDPIALHPVEVDLLGALAEVRPPFPLDVPATGTTREQRTRLFGVARDRLAARGLADERGPLGGAGTFVRLLRAGAAAVDLVFADHGVSRGLVALVHDQQALLVAQSPDDPDRVVWLAEVGTDTAVHELLKLLPDVPAGDVPSFSVSLPAVRQVFQRLNDRRPPTGGEPEPLSDNDMDGLLWNTGLGDRTIGRLVTSMQQVTGSGQIGAARWHPTPGRWQRLGVETHWVDTARGRFRVSASADGQWASVNPFSRTDARAELRRLAATVRGVDPDDGFYDEGWME